MPFAVSFILQKSAIDIHQSSIRPSGLTKTLPILDGTQTIDISLIFIHSDPC